MARILVIDDEPGVRAAMEVLLTTAGHAVTLAKDGREGVAKSGAGTFDLVIVDLFMPGTDGIETIRALRMNVADLPILAISGYAARGTFKSPDYLDIATKLGASSSLAKPFRPQQLLDAVEACLADARN